MEIGGRLPTSLHSAFVKILAFQQKSSTVPIMNLSPADIADLFTFVEVTCPRHSVTAANTKVNRKKANKVEVIQEEPRREEPQANAITPRPKSRGPGPGNPLSPSKEPPKAGETKQSKVARAVARAVGKEGKGSQKREISSAFLSPEETARRVITAIMNITWTPTANLYQLDLSSSRDTTKPSKGSMRAGPRAKIFPQGRSRCFCIYDHH